MYSHDESNALNLGPERPSGQTLAQLAPALFDEIECGLIVCDEQGADQLMVSVLPFQLPGALSDQVLVVLGRRQHCSELGLEMLAGSYGLTLAEPRVLSGLVRQATPREIA